MESIFISFDYDNDRHYKYLLSAWNNSKYFKVDFLDRSSGKIDSSDISRIKAVLTTRIRQATHFLLVIGNHINNKHKDCVEIGNTNWQHWELSKAQELGKKIIAVKIEKSIQGPPHLYDTGAKWALDFSEPAIVKALS